MPVPIDPLRFYSLTTDSTDTTLADNLTLCTIINNGTTDIQVFQNGDSYAVGITIAAEQGISFSAASSEILPTLKITTGAATTNVSVITN